jgi:uncharacterized protein (UPF0548 family)
VVEWRFGRGWSEAELAERLAAMRRRPRNFDETEAEMRPGAGWRSVRSEAVIGREGTGPPEPDGVYDRALVAMAAFRFSDPSIVVGHFRADTPLEERTLLLELKVWGLRYLCGVRVMEVHRDTDPDRTLFGWRYDTLAGHIEAGFEWFFLTKEHATGDVRFAIRARWRAGEFPNAWSRVGFHVLGPRRQELWHRRAHERLAALARSSQVPAPLRVERRRLPRLAHEGPVITFSRGEPHR